MTTGALEAHGTPPHWALGEDLHHVKYQISSGRLRAWTQAAVAVACTAVLSMGALPTLDTAAAAPKEKPLSPGKRCDELYGIKNTPTRRLPGGDTSRPKAQWDEFDYVNTGKQYDGLQLPEDAAEREDFLDKIGKNPDAYGKGDPGASTPTTPRRSPSRPAGGRPTGKAGGTAPTSRSPGTTRAARPMRRRSSRTSG